MARRCLHIVRRRASLLIGGFAKKKKNSCPHISKPLGPLSTQQHRHEELGPAVASIQQRQPEAPLRKLDGTDLSGRQVLPGVSRFFRNPTHPWKRSLTQALLTFWARPLEWG